MRLSLLPCEPDDVDQLTHLTHHTISHSPPDRMITLFFGPTHHPAALLATRRNWASRFTDPHDILLKLIDLGLPDIAVPLIDPQTGESSTETVTQPRILAMANWKLIPRYVPSNPPYGRPISEGGAAIQPEHMVQHTDPALKAEAAEVMDIFRDRRREEQREAHLHLLFMMVDPAFQRRGLGGMLMGWGDRVADGLGFSCWVEGSEMGRGLYERHGFVVMNGGERWVMKTRGEGEGKGGDGEVVGTWVMRREARALVLS